MRPQIKVLSMLLFIFIAIFLGLVVVYEKVLQPKATAGVPSLFFATNPSSLPAGGNFELLVKTNPNGASFHAFELYISYDPTKVEFQNSDLPQNIISSYNLVIRSVNTQNNTITIVGVRTQTPFSGSFEQEIAKVLMRVKPGALGNTSFTFGEASKLGDGLSVERIQAIFQIGGGQAAEVNKAQIRFTSSTSSYRQGENIDLQMYLNTNNNDIKAADVVFRYDDTRISLRNQIETSQNIILNSSSGFNTGLTIRTIDTANRRIIIGLPAQVVNQTSVPVRGDILLGTVTFQAKSDAAPGSVVFLTEVDSRAYDTQARNVLSEANPSYVISIVSGQAAAAQPAAVQLNLQLKFQGITSKPQEARNRILSTVKLVKPGETKTNTGVVFTAGDTGIWSGTTSFDVVPGGGYKILIKGQKHLQKRICVNNPQEAEPGLYKCVTGEITLQTGANTLDLSRTVLLSGDVDQNGIVNALDTTFIRNNIDKSDENALRGDLNLDGVTNASDFSLAIASLSFKPDEE